MGDPSTEAGEQPGEPAIQTSIEDSTPTGHADADDHSPAIAPTRAPPTREERESLSGTGGNGLATGLQQGGTIPGGSPAALEGSVGTGGGSTRNQPTGDAEQVR